MRSMIRILLAGAVLVGVGGWSWSQTGPACACSCAPSTPQETADRADAIVVGRAVSVTESGTDRYYRFEVDASYKRQMTRRIIVATPASSAACGIEVEIGAVRTLVLDEDAPPGEAPRWSAVLCSDLTAPAEPSVTAFAGPRLAPLSGSEEEPSDMFDGVGFALTPWLVMTLGVAIGLAAGLFAGLVWLVRRMRR